MDPSDFLGKPITRDYRPGIVGASARGYDQRGFLSWGDVEYMKRDPQVAFGLRILYAPLPQVKWKVKAKSEEVAKYVDRTLQKVWTHHLHDLADCLCYGHAGGEVLWRHDEETDTIEFDRLKPVHSPDLRPLERCGEFAGVSVQGVSGGEGAPGHIFPPRSLWVVYDRIPGTLYGRGRMGPTWQPWQEKTARHGALDVRRLWFVKNVFRGGIIRHPPGEIETAPGVYQSCQDYARELVEKMEAGGVLTLPNVVDEHGNQLWTYEEPKVNGDLTGVREYAGDLDREILVALGIPPEVVDAADSGSGWSGRSVPFLVWLSSEDMIAWAIIQAVVNQVCRPGVAVNYGEQPFEVEPVSLVPKAQMDDAAQAGDEGGAEAAPAAPPPPPVTPDPVAQPVQMSSDGSWTRYEGSHGGKGWKHSGTGEIRYQEKQPSGGSDDEGGKSASGEDAKTPEEARRITIKDLLGLPAAATVGAKQAIARVGQPVWDTLSPKTQERLTKALKIGKAIEHKAMIAFHKGKELSVEVARERGLGEEHAERVGKIIAIADQAVAWTTTFPVVSAVTGNPAIGKVASFLPMASFGYLAMSTARNPYAMWRAAKKVFGKTHGEHAEQAGLPHNPPPTMFHESVHMSMDSIDREAVAALLAGFDAHPEGEERDWYEALIYAALDATEGDLAAAVRQADEHIASNPPPGDGDVQLSQDAAQPHGDPWVRYEGKRGGRGWRNTQTGRIVYGENKPSVRGGVRKGATKATAPHARPDVGSVAARIKQLRELGTATAEDIQDLAHNLMSLRVVDIQAINKAQGIRGGRLKAELVQKVREYVVARAQAEAEKVAEPEPEAKPARTAKPGAGDSHSKNSRLDVGNAGGKNSKLTGSLAEKNPKGAPDGSADRTGSPGAGAANADAGGPVAAEAGGSRATGADQGRDGQGKSPDPAAVGRVPAGLEEVNKRINRFESFFRSREQHRVADWLGQLRSHVNAMGPELALAALNPSSEGKKGDGSEVQYWGVGTEEANWKNMGEWMEGYLARNGIIAVTGDSSDPNLPLISALGAPDKYVAGDFKPAGMHYTDKLTEAKDLPGLETSEDISKIMGKPVTHLTQEVTDKLDEKYGKGQWIVKCYDDNAAAGYGIFFPQRAAAIAQDARNTIWNAGSALGQYGFRLARNPDTGKVVGLVHETGDTYPFGSEEYKSTINGDAREWGDRAAAAAHSEQGALLPEGSFMAQPAFQAVGISDAERAAGKTWHEKNEGRVHLVTREDGNVEVIPHSTWLKGGSLPVVFEDEDTKAMAEAARAAIASLPPEARRGQVYAPDIMKTADGYRVVELNAQGDNNGSGYLHDNHFTIDAYTSHLAGRAPAHVAFIRQLLTSRKKKD